MLDTDLGRGLYAAGLMAGKAIHFNYPGQTGPMSGSASAGSRPQVPANAAGAERRAGVGCYGLAAMCRAAM